jgi:uncharacterized protein with FMN-binding domain
VADNKKVANSVVALSSAAVLAIYGTGYARTRAAADRFAQQAAERRPHIPASRGDGETLALALSAPPVAAALIPANDTMAEPATAAAKPLVPEVEKKAEPPVANPEVDAAKPGTLAKEAPARTTVKATEEYAAPATASPAAESAVTEGGRAQVTQVPELPAVPAPAPPPALPAPAQDAAKALYKDGTYYGWGTSRHGDIQAAVVIESGRIAVARVERCLTRYSCSWITPIPPRILVKQGTTYDYVSGATESSDAFQDAVSEALSQAK